MLRREFLKTAGMAALTATLPGVSYAGLFDRFLAVPVTKPVLPITQNDEFYVTSYRSPPTIRLQTWQLNVNGLVERPLTFSYRQLVDRPLLSEIVTLECVGNTVGGEFISTAKWEGPSLKVLLEEAGVSPEAFDVVFRSADGYSESLPLKRVMQGDVLIAHRMNGVPLPPGHGFPARIIAPGHYGMKSVQWLTEVEVVQGDYQGYYQQKGWTDEAIVKTMSRIEVPTHGETLKGLQQRVLGLAFAGLRGIQGVEVSVDEGGSWQPASLADPLSPFAWRFWTFDWQAPRPGRYTLTVRAIDGLGRVQTTVEEDPAPDGAAGQHQVTVSIEA
jgi:DMSO/TMAO reductase YedYZ molybdopterin-dependent catalytic subunit